MRFLYKSLVLILCFMVSLCVFAGCNFGGSVNLGGGQDNTGDGAGDNTDDGNDDGANDSDGNDTSAPAVFEQDGLTYTLQSNNTYTVTACNKSTSGTEITVLGEIEGVKVTAIGDDAFRNHKTVTKVTLPDSVTKIGSSAFNACAKLKNVNLENVKIIGDSAFKSSNLLSADLSSLTQFSENAFSSTKLSSVEIPSGIEEIPNEAFSSCSILKSVVLPNTVQKIGAKAFVNCSLLASINLESVLYVEEYSFQSCVKLGAVTLTNAVYIKDWAFASTGIPSIVIGENCVQVYMDAFDSCKSLQSMTLGSASKFTWFFILETTGGTKYKIDYSGSYPIEWREVWIKDPVLCKDFISVRNHNAGCYIATAEWLANNPM